MITFKAKDASGEIINSALSPFTFPAGEAHIKREDKRDLEPTEIAIIQPDANSIHDDLFQLAMWNDYVLTQKHQPQRVLILPYVPGARADRGIPFGLKIYTDFLNAMDLDQIIVFDPHSEATEQILGMRVELPGHSGFEDTLTVVHSHELFDQKHMRAVLNGYTGIIAPDKGAAKRAQAVADVADLPVFTASKVRDEATGKLSNFSIDGLDLNGNYLIVDDICDGGGTFLGLAEASRLEYGQLDLYVSHGVFSKDALKNLRAKFEYIFTTNSYSPLRDLNVHDDMEYNAFRRFDVIRFLESKIKY